MFSDEPIFRIPLSPNGRRNWPPDWERQGTFAYRHLEDARLGRQFWVPADRPALGIEDWVIQLISHKWLLLAPEERAPGKLGEGDVGRLNLMIFQWHHACLVRNRGAKTMQQGG
jgi:hypothetical protein